MTVLIGVSFKNEPQPLDATTNFRNNGNAIQWLGGEAHS